MQARSGDGKMPFFKAQQLRMGQTLIPTNSKCFLLRRSADDWSMICSVAYLKQSSVASMTLSCDIVSRIQKYILSI